MTVGRTDLSSESDDKYPKKKRSRSEEKFQREYIQECKDMIQEIERNILYHRRTIALFRKDLSRQKNELKEAEAET